MSDTREFNIDCMKYRKSTHLASVDVDAMIAEKGSCELTIKLAFYEKGVDVSGKQTGTHPGKAEQKEFSLPLSHTQSGDQQRRGHAKKYVFNICHVCTAFPVAGSSANRQPVSRRSNQQ